MIEGSCLVGKLLYNAGGRLRPEGIVYNRNTVAFKFGKGNGADHYNTTNALDPCRTVAADQAVYPKGTAIYIPAMKGKLCPQSGAAIDGCFVVGDIGSAIKGRGRFDMFTGECADYSKRSNTCRDRGNAAFGVQPGTKFRVIERDQPLAVALRREADTFIGKDWKN